jgi:O-antigen/teichoic acid export membrane protein
MGWTDTLMLGYFSSSGEVGIYNAALPTAQLIRAIPGAFATIFFPVVSELYARNKIDDLRTTYSAVTKWMVSLIFPAFLLVLLFPQQVIGILFGADYVAGATALWILVLGFTVGAVLGPASAILQTYGRTKTLMATSYIGAAINFLLNFLLIPIYGVNGAAIATAVSLALLYILNFLFARRVAKIQPFRLSYLKIIIASLLSVSIVYAITKYVIGVSIPSLIGMLFVFLALYFFLLLLFKSFEEEDLMIMRAIDQKLGTKSNWIRRIIQRFL